MTILSLCLLVATAIGQVQRCAGLDPSAEVVTSYWLNQPIAIGGSFYDPADDRLYLSYGDSPNAGIRRYLLDVDQQTTEVEYLYENPEGESGRGLTRIGDLFYQITYQDGILNEFTLGFDDDENAILELQHQYAIPRDDNCVVPEGWGLTDDETFLYMSDGSHHIYRINPETLSEFDPHEFRIIYGADECPEDSHFDHIYSIFESDTGDRMEGINELELVNQNLYANIYDESLETYRVISIATEPDSESMTIERVYDFCLLHELLCEELLRAGVSTTCEGPANLNGIAYHNPTNSFLLSGINWPILFQATLDDNLNIQ
ncbi:unnamed protein product [Moneuplotes crassus]|uniref:Phytase-like domain-containing protein n=1 Tax=Euplotes crassus TaxID=5936 RepID=A0AAD1XP90_EUPCR|nr:unnamed protein product [Moneuplotes crassus]